MEKVYLVGDCGPEHDHLIEIHLNKDKALRAFQKHRLDLLGEAKDMLKHSKEEAEKHLKSGNWFGSEKLSTSDIEYLKKTAEFGSGIYSEMVKNLSEEDPKKIDNYPHSTPYLREMKVTE